MTTSVALVLALTVCLDVAGQLLFKHGLAAHTREGRGLLVRVLSSLPIAAGVCLYGAEFVAWLFVLSRADLSVAFPIATLSYVGVVLACRLLGETVPRRRWIATLLIAAGAALVGASA